MAAVEYSKLGELCRICATKITTVSAINIFETEGVMRQISKKICTCLPIQVHKTDKFPKNICQNCLHKLDLFFDFRESSARAQTVFVKLYEQFTSVQAHNDDQQSFIVPMDHNELVVVQRHQILDEDSLQLTRLGEGEDAIVKEEIILTHDNVDMNLQSLGSIDLDIHDLNSQDLSNHSLQSRESIIVGSQTGSKQHPLFTGETVGNFMQEHKLLSDQFRLQQHYLDVDMTDVNSEGGNTQLINNYINCDSQKQNQELNFEIKIECDEIKLEDDEDDEPDLVDTHLVDEQLNNISAASSVTDKQMCHFNIESIESLEHLSNDKDEVYCKICRKMYEEKSVLEHYKSHLYQCATCATVFMNADSLNSHRKDGACVENTKGKELDYISEVHPREKQDISALTKNIDSMIKNSGGLVQHTASKLEHIERRKEWKNKKNMCPYCCVEVTHFPRHLLRHHDDEGAVKEINSLSIKDPKRRMLLNVMRRQGNYVLNKQASTIRPIRRPRKTIENKDSDTENYAACDYCLGFLKKPYLRRHMNKCSMRQKKVNHLPKTIFAQDFGAIKKLYHSSRLRKELLESIKSDEISEIVKADILICSYAESELKKHNQIEVNATMLNKIRDLGRLLLVLRKTNGAQRFIDFLKPEYFANIVTAAKIISDYHKQNFSLEASSLAANMDTKLKQICDIATEFIIKKNLFPSCKKPKESLKNIKQLRELIEHYWNSEIASLAVRDLNETRWEKQELLPLIRGLFHFQKFVIEEANTACENLKKNENDQAEYRKLSEYILVLTLLLNRKRIKEIQFLKLKTYLTEPLQNQQKEYLESLSESEKILSQSFKLVVTGGIGSKPVAILFPEKIQLLINVMLSVRQKCVPNTNEYLFADSNTENKWLSGYDILRSLVDRSSVINKKLFTSTKIRKQIATVVQIMNMSKGEMDQFANFMGHTKETHEEYYRLPQDIHQIAKISKLFFAINKGKGAYCKGKTLSEIEFSDNEESDNSDTEETEKMCEQNYLASLISEPTANCGDQDNIEGKSIAAEDESTRPCCSNTTAINLIIKPVAHEERFKRKNVEGHHTVDTDKSEIDEPTRDIKKRKIRRNKWTERQRSKICDSFKDHIKYKIAPRKDEVEKFRLENRKLFEGRNWVAIKAYVYNTYRDR